MGRRMYILSLPLLRFQDAAFLDICRLTREQLFARGKKIESHVLLPQSKALSLQIRKIVKKRFSPLTMDSLPNPASAHENMDEPKKATIICQSITPLRVYSPHVSRIACCDRGYGRPSGRPRVSDPATYCSSTPRIQPPAVARWHAHLHGLATPIRET